MCQGTCFQRIKKGSNFYSTDDGAKLYCTRCYTALPPKIPSLQNETDVDGNPSNFLNKSLLKKRMMEEGTQEQFVQCSKCKNYYHDICVLIHPDAASKIRNSKLDYTCLLCTFDLTLCSVVGSCKTSTLPNLPQVIHQLKENF